MCLSFYACLVDGMCICSLIAMTLAGKMYFEAVGKIGENAAVSPVSRELGEFQSNLV